jgi:transcriptional regulator with XRE-family HTH domain
MTTKSKLLKLRENLNFTQDEMAQKLNMSQSTYSNYENYPSRMKDDVKKHIANTFNFPVEDLMPGGGDAVFENGSINNGSFVVNAQNYYHVPKELMDNWLNQQKTLATLIEKLTDKI